MVGHDDAVGAELAEALEEVFFPGEEDDGDVAEDDIALEGAAEGEAVELRHEDVGNHEVGARLVREVEGASTEAYVELFCRGTVAPAELKRILSNVPEVVDAGTVTGSADAIVHMRSRDIPSLELALERVRVAPNVDHTRSAIVLSRLIHRSEN